MQRTDKPTISNAFWNADPAGDLPYIRHRKKDSWNKASRIAWFTSSRPSSLGDDG
jgi:hypothetical protein